MERHALGTERTAVDMMMRLLGLTLFLVWSAGALERPGVVFKVFQFPADKIPRIDGRTDDWDIVPDDYAIGIDQLKDTSEHAAQLDRKDLDVRVKVGWVKGLNRLYFLYEAFDNYWDFARKDLHNDTFELVVDGDLSGGSFLEPPGVRLSRKAIYQTFQNVYAQNYHIFTPALDKDWTMVWGCQNWLKDLPYANAAYNYNFRPGESGHLVLEFWITPFDYAACEGPAQSRESQLTENKLIGMSWAILDYDDVNSDTHTFWNLSHNTLMYGDASRLVAFRLMPLEPSLRKPIQADWLFRVLDMDRRVVSFQDRSQGEISNWTWDFGDGTRSAEQHPIHVYKQDGQYVVDLTVRGPAGESHHAKVWDVTILSDKSDQE